MLYSFLNRYTSTYNHDDQKEHPTTFHHSNNTFTNTKNVSQYNNAIDDGDKLLNITTSDDFKENFDQLILTTPTTDFFDAIHRQYENDPMFNHLGDGETDHHEHHDDTNDDDDDDAAVAEQTIVTAVTTENILDTIRKNSTDTQHRSIFYNNSEITNTHYDVATNEIRNSTHDHDEKYPDNSNLTNIPATTEKRGKYLHVLNDGSNDVNLTIPNAAEVWALASMKNFGHDKMKSGQYYNVTTTTKSDKNAEPARNNGTVATKQLADWVEVMKNEVFGNVTYGNNETAINHLKEPNDNLPQDNASQENHIVAITEGVVALPIPPPPIGQPTNPENFTNAERVVNENKIDTPPQQTKIDDVAGDFEVDDLAKSKLKPSIKNDTIDGGDSHLARTTAIEDIVKNVLPIHDDDLNSIRKIIYPSVARNNISTTTAVPSIRNTTNLPLVHITTTITATTTDEPTITTTEHQIIDDETTQQPDATEPTTILTNHLTSTEFNIDDDVHMRGPSDLSNVLTTTTILATTDYGDGGHLPTTTATEFVTTTDGVTDETTHKINDNNLITPETEHEHLQIQPSTLQPNFIEEPTTVVQQQQQQETTTTNVIGSKTATTTTTTRTTTGGDDNEHHQATTVISLNRDGYKYSTVVDVVDHQDAATTTTTATLQTAVTGSKRKSYEKPLIAGVDNNNGAHKSVNGPTIDETPTELPAVGTSGNPMPGDLGEIGADIQTDDTDVNAIIATTVSIVGVVCLILLVGFLVSKLRVLVYFLF